MHYTALAVAMLIGTGLSALVATHNISFHQLSSLAPLYQPTIKDGDMPENWPTLPWTLGDRPIAIRFEEAGHKVTDLILKDTIIEDLESIAAHFLDQYEDLRYHAPIEYSSGHVTLYLVPSGQAPFAGYLMGEALSLVLELFDDWDWDVIEILRAQFYTLLEPEYPTAEFAVEFRGV